MSQSSGDKGIFPTLKLSVTAAQDVTSTNPVQVEVIYDRVVQNTASTTTGPTDGTPTNPGDVIPAPTNPSDAPPGTNTPSGPANTGTQVPQPQEQASAGDANDPADADDKVTHSRETVRFQLDSHLKGNATLNDVDFPSTIAVQILGADGVPRVVINRDVTKADANGVTINLDAANIKNILAEIDLPPARPVSVTRTAILTEIIIGLRQNPFDFARAKLFTVPLAFTNGGEWDKLGFAKFFDLKDGPASVSGTFAQALPPQIASLPWTSTRVAVDGRFTANFLVSTDSKYNAWAWLLTGSRPYGMLGVIAPDVIKKTDAQARAIILPAAPKADGDHGEGGNGHGSTGTGASDSQDCHCDDGSRVPTVVSEAELANNPNVYTEDPGAFCTPFKNPERILSEQPLFSVLRVEQPEISSSASHVIRNPILDFGSNIFLPDRPQLQARESNAVIGINPRVGSLSAILRGLGSGRREMDAQNPIQWEGDSLRYQATTVAKGHCLEFRVRTRSNGYSLGKVSKTLTLAPRQTKRIQKIEWARSERAVRVESQQGADTTNDSMDHETSYQDAVAASLNEWAQGSSKSSVTGAAGGAGLALGPFVIGGGVAHSSSKSSSQSSGGRNTTASEESQWRDAVRRHGDALRKFESTVVQEVTERESVTGTTEVIRNINYGHSMTVIYHNILRHLRADTEFAGVRECLFVPFAIRPFTQDRALRWRESISKSLRNRSYARALTYIKDVATDFATSSIPAGRRSDHPIKSLYGSLYIELGVARPGDKDDGKFDVGQWNPLMPFLPSPAFGIWQTLFAFDAAIRDQMFQQRHAPTIASKWCDELQIKNAKGILDADFTLATPYRFNNTVRVDFQVAPDDTITRESLNSFTVLALKPLPPGSNAKIKSVSFNYETDFEKGSLSLNRGINDLIKPETGIVDPQGALFTSVPSAYERRDVRQELRLAVLDLISHLNEYVEWYHKAIWWNMDRDRLFMLLDGFTVPKLNQPVSIANVVEREPLAVAGNCLVFRVSAGVYLGNPELKLTNPDELYDYYNSNKSVSEPMHISLPTDGLYAQTIMDECNALEEHRGNEDWALSDPDPELGTLDASLLATRRSEPTNLTPSTLPGTIINLTNATPGPAPQGFGGVLGAVQNANAFRDMAGLEGTQQLATAGLQTAANLATTFGGSAASLEMAKITGKKQAVADTDQKLASIERAKKKNLVTDEKAKEEAGKALGELGSRDPTTAPHEDPEIKKLIDRFTEDDTEGPKTFEAINPEGSVKLAFRDSNADFELVSATTKGKRPPWSTFNSLYWRYDRKKSSDVLAAINSAWVGNASYANTCTMRLSQALNDYGTPITKNANKIPAVVTEYSFQNKQRYIVRVVGGRAYLLNQWGAPEANVFKKAGEAFDPAKDPKFKDRKGVIIFEIGFSDASGHIDLFDGKTFSHERPSGWDGTGTNPHEYWKMATNIMLFYLPDSSSGSGSGGSGSGTVTTASANGSVMVAGNVPSSDNSAPETRSAAV